MFTDSYIAQFIIKTGCNVAYEHMYGGENKLTVFLLQTISHGMSVAAEYLLSDAVTINQISQEIAPESDMMPQDITPENFMLNSNSMD